MPGATDGAWKYGKWLGCEEIAGKYGGKSCVLHAHLDADGALLGGIEACQSSGTPTEYIPQGVVAEHYGKCPKEKYQTTGYEVIVYGRDDATHDKGKASDADTRHQALDSRETFLFTVDIVEKATDGNGDNCDYQNIDEHTYSIHLNDLTCRNFH